MRRPYLLPVKLNSGIDMVIIYEISTKFIAFVRVSFKKW